MKTMRAPGRLQSRRAGGSSRRGGPGSASPFDFLVTRWDSNGAWDSRFGGPRDPKSGRPPGAVADFGLFNADQARALAIQPDGKIVVAGRSEPGYDHSGDFENDEPGDFALARYRMDSLDPPDADADGVTNDRDLCDRISATLPDGCPHYARTVTIRYSNRDKAFRGRISSDQRECDQYVPVTVFRNRPGEDVQVGRPSSAPVYWVRSPRRPGLVLRQGGEDVGVGFRGL